MGRTVIVSPSRISSVPSVGWKIWADGPAAWQRRISHTGYTGCAHAGEVHTGVRQLQPKQERDSRQGPPAASGEHRLTTLEISTPRRTTHRGDIHFGYIQLVTFNRACKLDGRHANTREVDERRRAQPATCKRGGSRFQALADSDDVGPCTGDGNCQATFLTAEY